MKKEKTYFERENGTASFSLLFPLLGSAGEGNSFLEQAAATAHDLGLAELIAAFAPERAYQKEIQWLFQRLPCDREVISYRQDVLEDLLHHPGLAEKFASYCPRSIPSMNIRAAPKQK